MGRQRLVEGSSQLHWIRAMSNFEGKQADMMRETILWRIVAMVGSIRSVEYTQRTNTSKSKLRVLYCLGILLL
jgi:hypothetical protein